MKINDFIGKIRNTRKKIEKIKNPLQMENNFLSINLLLTDAKKI